MDTFDNFAKAYDAWYESQKGKFIDKLETKLILDLMSSETKMEILDIGCGTGNLSMKLAELGHRVTGIDLSEAMLERAKAKAKAEKLEIDFRLMDACSTDFKDDTFDAVVSVTAIEFAKQPESMVKEALRVVKSKGKVIFGTINKDSDWGRAYIEQGKSPNSVYHQANFLSDRDLSAIESDQLVEMTECLYISPNSPVGDYDLARENKSKEFGKGGFVCGLWIKK
ncbi:MAG: methyltransferase domain-containing protein [Bacilli bacterium]|nr:methyltransferase domain-containing protein [Bacilli bacterium]